MAVKYALVREEQTSGTNGGSAVATTWTTRVLNTVAYDPNTLIVSLTSNAFTLGGGTYVIRALAPMFATSSAAGKATRLRIFNQTGTAVVVYGLSQYFLNSVSMGSNAVAIGVVAPTSNTAYRIEYYATNAQAANGLGQASSTGAVEVYTQVEIWKIL